MLMRKVKIDHAVPARITTTYKKLPKYYKRLLIIYFVLMVIVLATVTYSVVFLRESKDDYSIFVEKTLEFEKAKNETEVVFDTMDVIVELITRYDVTREYAVENTSVYANYNFERMHAISQILTKIQTDFSGYNLNMALTRISDEIVITGNGTTETLKTFMENNDIDVVNAVTKLSECNEEGFFSVIVTKKELSDRLDMIYRINYADVPPVYMILSFSRDDVTYIHDEKNATGYIYNNYNAEYEKLVKKKITTEGISQTVGYIEIHNSADTVFFSTAEINDEKIIYVKIFNEPEENVILLTAIWIVFILAAATVLAIILARISYIPLRRILQRLGIEGTESFDEVEAAETTINSIIGHNSDMRAAIGNKNRLIKNHVLLDLLNGFIWGEQLEATSKEYAMEFLTGDCCIVVIEIWGSALEFASDENDVYSNLRDMFETLENCACCRISEKRIAIICIKEESIKNAVLDRIDTVRSEYNLRITAALHEVSGGSGEIPKTYRMLLNGLDNKALTNRMDIITLEDIRKANGDRFVYSTETEGSLIDYCENGEKEKAILLLKTVFDANNSIETEAFKALRYAFAITSKRILSNLNVSETDIFESRFDCAAEILDAKDFDELLSIMKDMIEIITDYVAENKESENKNLGDEILAFIKENLARDISVADVSGEFGISPSYIGRILRTNYNTSFKQYLDEVRIKKAKQMMDENKDILIKDLAQSLGYNNVVSFIRMFKKSEGISPGHYIKM